MQTRNLLLVFSQKDTRLKKLQPCPSKNPNEVFLHIFLNLTNYFLGGKGVDRHELNEK